ncbi:uncharacterized protein LOC118435162 [Folsomia candida]|uniref:Uncharacterized protein n=1 Tax=Folsomia candida TaxID=158441 RepID=A0A226ED72_FOLCA|nr:uncharacterized protein LOC118435162 [Folsomia candida]OXA55178.1 hypothetical protein Fcan01_09067 [Folsomia candida]
MGLPPVKLFLIFAFLSLVSPSSVSDERSSFSVERPTLEEWMEDIGVSADSSSFEKWIEIQGPPDSKLGQECDTTAFKQFSFFELLNIAATDGKLNSKAGIDRVFKEIRKLIQSTPEATINQTCVTKGQIPELLECIDKVCVCYKTGIWAPMNLVEENGDCVSPNGAWCIHWGNDATKVLSKCAGRGRCNPPEEKLPLLCDQLDMGVCAGGRGPVAKTNITDAPKCFVSGADPTFRPKLTSLIIIVVSIMIMVLHMK